MLSFTARVRPSWPLLTLFGSAALLAGAHAFETFGGLRPCPLCLQQREWHWGVVAASVVALVVLRLRPNLARWMALSVGLVLLGSAAMGAYHVAVEQHWVIAQCDAAGSIDDIRLMDFDEELVAPSCDQIAWSMFGISMAGYNALISLLLALASFAVAALPEPKA